MVACCYVPAVVCEYRRKKDRKETCPPAPAPVRTPATPGFSQGIPDILLGHLEVVTGSATWSTQENPLQVLPVTNDVTAGGRAVRTDIGGMLRHGRGKVGEGIPIRGMRRKFVAVQMAQPTGWPGPADAVQVRPVTKGIGAGGSGGIVQFDEIPMQGICVGSPLVGVYGVLVAEVALSAGDLRNPPAKIGAVTGGTVLHMGFRLRLVFGRQPAKGVFPTDGIQIGLRILVPASDEQKEGKQQ
jgi:hypothetical protein